MANNGEVVERVEVERKVMVAIDESECSYNALMWVLDNLQESLGTDSKLVIFMAQPPSPSPRISFPAPLASVHMYYPVLVPELTNSVQEQKKKLALALLEKAKEICAGRGVCAETITEIGDPKTTICSVVENLNIGMLVLGDHGLSKLKRAFLGSVTNYCMKHAKCSVLVVRKP